MITELIKKNILELIMRAGEIQRQYFIKSDHNVIYKKNSTPVTCADIEANKILRHGLAKILPSAQWLSEEDSFSHNNSEAEWVWIVDPLDGTKDFIAGIPEFAISIALANKGNPVFGAVLNPITLEYGIGGENFGVEFGGFRPMVDAKIKPITTSRSDHRKITKLLTEQELCRFKGMGSIAYRILKVAHGIDSATLTLESRSIWDVFGGFALAKAAQKEIRNFDRQPIVCSPLTLRTNGGILIGEKKALEFIENMFK